MISSRKFGDYISEKKTYTRDNRRSSKCEHGILHSTIGKAWWKYENIIGRPCIRIDYFLGSMSVLIRRNSFPTNTNFCSLNKSFRIGLELPLGVLNLSRSGSHNASRSNGSISNITTLCKFSWIGNRRDRLESLPAGYGKQITWNRDVLLERIE